MFDGLIAGMNRTRLEEATELFHELRAAFPSVEMRIDTSDPHVDISVEMPVQRELAFNVCLNLQNDDELHLAVDGSFWCSWFPSSDPQVREEYKRAVGGFLSGTNRILEHRRWGRHVKAELQAPEGQGWRTIGSSQRGLFPLPWFCETHVLRNEVTSRGGVE